MTLACYRMVSPKNRRGLEYWSAKREGRRMPSRADIDPAEIRDILPHIVLLDVQQDPLDFRYRLIGAAVEARLGRFCNGMWMSEMPNQRAPSRIWSACMRVIAEKAPITTDVPYLGPMPGFDMAEDILLPLSEHDDRVDMIMVVVDYLRKDQAKNRSRAGA